MKSSTVLRIVISGMTILCCICVNAQRFTLKDAGEQWQKTMDLKKADLITGFFDTSIVAIYHNNPVVYGKEANLKIWQHQFNDSLDQHPITIEKVDVSSSGDMGYIYGRWWSIHPSENYFNGGRYVSVWKLRNNKWRIVMLSVNVQDDVKDERTPK
jgi:ketosteroid isomerase-like protein